jgi:hypothetical protein
VALIRGETGTPNGRVLLNVFVRGANGNLLEYHWNGAAWFWRDTGRAVAGDPIAVMRGETGTPNGRVLLNVFVRGANGNLLEYHWNGAAWSWRDTGRAVAGDPAALIRSETGTPNGRVLLNVFVRGANGNLLEYHWNGATWSWRDTGQAVAGDPEALIRGETSTPTGRVLVNVFVRGADGNLLEHHWDGKMWLWRDTGMSVV